MRTRANRLILLLATTFMTSSIACAETPVIDWKTELNVAWTAARTEKRPLLLYVSQDGCAYCEKMQRGAFQNPGVVAQVQKSFVPAKIKAKDAPRLIKRLGVDIYPTTVVVSAQAEVLDTIVGYLEAEALLRRLQKASQPRTARKPD